MNNSIWVDPQGREYKVSPPANTAFVQAYMDKIMLQHSEELPLDHPNGAVTEEKLVAQAVTSAKIASGAVTSEKISPLTVSMEHIQDGAISASKIASGAVIESKIANGAVTEGKIPDGNIYTRHFAADALAPKAVSAQTALRADSAAVADAAQSATRAAADAMGNNIIATYAERIEVNAALNSISQSMVSKIEGKGLSTNDYTNADKTRLANTSGTNTGDQDLSGLQPKQAGKGLSTEDYTTNEKLKLERVQEGAEVNVNADWEATTGDAQILHKPTIKDFDFEYDVEEVIDYNSYIASGIYKLNQNYTIPAGGRSRVIILHVYVESEGGNWITQTQSIDGVIYVRNNLSGSWSAWSQIAAPPTAKSVVNESFAINATAPRATADAQGNDIPTTYIKANKMGQPLGVATITGDGYLAQKAELSEKANKDSDGLEIKTQYAKRQPVTEAIPLLMVNYNPTFSLTESQRQSISLEGTAPVDPTHVITLPTTSVPIDIEVFFTTPAEFATISFPNIRWINGDAPSSLEPLKSYVFYASSWGNGVWVGGLAMYD